jgi:hypothetical protein
MLIATPRRIGLRVLLIALAWLCIHTPVAAEIPVEEALGIYENTIVEHRNLSPLWGLVALESGVLANVRFFAHYGPTARPAYPIHPSLVKGPGDDHPQDAISGVVQYLFPSRILAKAVEPDLMPIRVLQNLLAERPDLAANRDFYPLPGLLKWPQASRDAILRGALADPKLVKLLLDHGADPNGAGGNEPIISTALLRTNGRPTVRAALLQLLLAHKPGIPLNVLSSFGAPPPPC